MPKSKKPGKMDCEGGKGTLYFPQLTRVIPGPVPTQRVAILNTQKTVIKFPKNNIVKTIFWTIRTRREETGANLKLNLYLIGSETLKSVNIHYVRIRMVGCECSSEAKVISIDSVYYEFFNSNYLPLQFEYEFLDEFKKPLDFGREESSMHSQGRVDAFRKLLKDGLFADLSLECEGGVLKAHRNIMCAQSEFFKRMLEGDTIEAKTQTVKCAYDLETMKEFLDYIYTGSEVNPALAKKLYLAADYYQVLELKSACMISISNNISHDNAISTLIFAKKNDAINLKENCISYIRSNIKQVADAKELLRFSEEFLAKEDVQIIIDAWASSQGAQA